MTRKRTAGTIATLAGIIALTTGCNSSQKLPDYDRLATPFNNEVTASGRLVGEPNSTDDRFTDHGVIIAYEEGPRQKNGQKRGVEERFAKYGVNKIISAVRKTPVVGMIVQEEVASPSAGSISDQVFNHDHKNVMPFPFENVEGNLSHNPFNAWTYISTILLSPLDFIYHGIRTIRRGIGGDNTSTERNIAEGLFRIVEEPFRIVDNLTDFAEGALPEAGALITGEAHYNIFTGRESAERYVDRYVTAASIAGMIHTYSAPKEKRPTTRYRDPPDPIPPPPPPGDFDPEDPVGPRTE